MKRQPLVSIITPLYNGASFVGDTIQSAQAQTEQNWEMIIVDDYSNDNSIEVVKRFKKEDSRIKLIKMSDRRGPAVARNRAIEESKGRFIAFLDSDDLWHPTKLERQVSFMQENDYPFTYTWYEEMDESGRPIQHTVKSPRRVTYSRMLKTCHIGCLTAMYDTHTVGKVYMPDIKRRQDYALWLKLLREVRMAYGLQETLAQYRKRNVSVSSNKFKLLKYNWEVLRGVEGLSFPSSVYYLSHVVWNKVADNRLVR